MEVLIGIVGSIATEIGTSLVAPVKRHIGYLIYYNRNITDLKDEREKLDDKIAEANQFVQDADKKFKLIIPGVPHWKEAADELNQKAFKFLENETLGVSNKCLNGRCQNPWSRYSSSKNASKMTEGIKNKIQDSPTFGNVAYDAPPPNLGPRFKLEGVKDFESRLLVINDVWEALKNDKLSMIGISGMGGVGKTTLVKKLVKRVEVEKLFGVVALIEVSRKPNLTIQHEIVERLGLEIKETTLDVRAVKLHDWIINCEKSILLILDDVWEEVDFEAIGLPLKCDNKGYIIMLTSRNDYLCSKIGSEKNFPIDILKEEEARDLLKATAGNSIDGLLLHTATEIADECGGLPIAIVTIAKALKNKPKDIWENALLQLKKSNMRGIPGMQKVHSKLELCCLFPEDYNVCVEDLVSYGMGLRLFGAVKNVHEVRIKVRALIYELKESFLLLQGDSKLYQESVKMHDLLRDVAISIASTDKYAYLVSCDSEMKNWPVETERYKSYNAISLCPSTFDEHPIDLECPKLQLLRLAAYKYSSEPLPNNFFEGMRELKVLSLAIPLSLPLLDSLKKLRTLDIDYLWSDEIFSIGALTNLEILRIGGGRVEEFPSEIGLLRNLRVLNVIRMVFSFIPSGVLLGLSKLEELYVGRYFKNWESIEDGKTNASLKELESHPMTALEISVSNPLLLPEESVISKVKKFKIFIGNDLMTSPFQSNDQMNELIISGCRNDVLLSGISHLLRNTETLNLDELEDEGFPVDILEVIPSSQEMFHLRNKDAYFHNLKYMAISNCHRMKYFFPLSIARGLKQLKSLEIRECSAIEGIFYIKEEDNENITSRDDDDIEFPKLTHLTLSDVPNLIDFCVDMNNAVVGHLSDQLRDDAVMKPLVSDKVLSDTQDVTEQVHATFKILLPHWLQLPNLQELDLKECGQAEVLLSTSVARQLVRLKTLKLQHCEKIKYVVEGGKGEEEGANKGTTKIMFPMLISLFLKTLPQLEAFYPDDQTSFEFPSLQELVIVNCPKIETFFPTLPRPLLTSNESVHSSIPSEKPKSRSMFSRMKRRGRGQKSDIQHHKSDEQLVSSEVMEEVSLMKNNYHSSSIYDHSKACSTAFSFKSMEGIMNLKHLVLVNLFNGNDALEVVFSFHDWHADGVVLNVLEELNLNGLSKLTHIIWLKNIPPEITAFQNLRSLSVSNCQCLKYIFSPRVAKLLVKLQDLRIQQCVMMEAIIGDEDEEGISHGKIVFPQLRILLLNDLDNLKSIYNINGTSVTVEFPILQELVLRRCKQIRTLSYRSSIITSYHNENVEERNKDETGQNESHPEARSSLSIISINGMQNLKRLEMKECNSFQVLFSIEDADADGVLNVLEHLELTCLENLDLVWLKTPSKITAFQSLKQLELRSCHRLKYLLSPHVAKLLVKLESISIFYCDMMEATVGAEEKESESEEEAKIASFPYLRSLRLESLPSLTSFCIERYVTIELPSLEHLELRKCNQMRIATKLKKVKIDGRYYQLEKDLNPTDMQEIMAIQRSLA